MRSPAPSTPTLSYPHPEYECVLGVGHVVMCAIQKDKTTRFGAVILTPLVHLDAPFGAGACTLGFTRVMEYHAPDKAVNVTNWYPPSNILLILCRW
jgi:hypothetical protein